MWADRVGSMCELPPHLPLIHRLSLRDPAPHLPSFAFAPTHSLHNHPPSSLLLVPCVAFLPLLQAAASDSPLSPAEVFHELIRVGLVQPLDDRDDLQVQAGSLAGVPACSTEAA